MVKEVHERLKPTPYELYGWTRVAGAKRTRDGTQRRRGISIFELINLFDAIVIAEAVVQSPGGGPTTGHAIVWDGWRRLLFIGPGAVDDRALDGTFTISREDQVRRHPITARPSPPLLAAPRRSSPLLAAPCPSRCSPPLPSASTALHRAWQADENRVEPTYDCTLTEYVQKKLGVTMITDAHILMVKKARAASTHHV